MLWITIIRYTYINYHNKIFNHYIYSKYNKKYDIMNKKFGMVKNYRSKFSALSNMDKVLGLNKIKDIQATTCSYLKDCAIHPMVPP